MIEIIQRKVRPSVGTEKLIERPAMAVPSLSQGFNGGGQGGYGGGGLPYASEVLQLWGGELRQAPIPTPAAPRVLNDDGSGAHLYAIVAVGPQGRRSAVSPVAKAGGLAKLRWNIDAGADAYIVVRDGKEVAAPMRLEGAHKEWTDKAAQ